MARYRRPAGRTNRRQLVWARNSISWGNNSTHATDVLADWRNDMDWNGLPGITIRRVRLDVLAHAYPITAVPEGEAGTAVNRHLGLLVANRNFTSDTIPRPDTDQHADWMMYKRVFAGSQGGYTASYEIDVKSQRKLEEIQQTLWVVADDPIGDPYNCALTMQVSTLLALP